MQPNDVIRDAASNIRRIIKVKIVDHTHSRDNLRCATCDNAKARIREQVDRVRAVFEPGVVVSKIVIAADRFVVNSGKLWSEWDKVARPDNKDLVSHPWYRLSLNESGQRVARPTTTITGKAEITSGRQGSGDSRKTFCVEIRGQAKDLRSQSERSTPITVAAQSHSRTSHTDVISSNTSCLTCIKRGITCNPLPGHACSECKAGKRKCSHSVGSKRSRSVSPPPPTARRHRTQTRERAEHDLPLKPPRESYAQADLRAFLRLPPPVPDHISFSGSSSESSDSPDVPPPPADFSLVPPSLRSSVESNAPPPPETFTLIQPEMLSDVSMDATFVPRKQFDQLAKDHTKLIREHNALVERISTLEDGLLTLQRVVQASGIPGPSRLKGV